MVFHSSKPKLATQVALTSLSLRNFQPNRGTSQQPWKTSQKNLKAAVRTEGIKVKVHVIDQFDTCNPIQLEDIFLQLDWIVSVKLVRKEVHFPTTHCGNFGAPFACCIGLSIRRFQTHKNCGAVFNSASPSLLHLWEVQRCRRLGSLWCGGTMGTPHCIRRAGGCVCFQQVGRGYGSQQGVLPGEGKMCECCPPLPYCGFGALVKIEFYVVDMCMERFD